MTTIKIIRLTVFLILLTLIGFLVKDNHDLRSKNTITIKKIITIEIVVKNEAKEYKLSN